MQKVSTSRIIRLGERVLVRLDAPPWGSIYRVVIGFAILPAMSEVWTEGRSTWRLTAFLLCVLMMLRVVPAVVRRLVPFSPVAQALWTRRRQIAKRWDSYQWQKVFWIGIGLAFYIGLSGQFFTSRIVVCSFCLALGGVGLAIWRSTRSEIDWPEQPAVQVRDLARQS